MCASIRSLLSRLFQTVYENESSLPVGSEAKLTIPRSYLGRTHSWARPRLRRAYHPEGPGGVVVLQRHLQPVVLGSILIHFGAGLIHLLPGRRGNRFLRVVPRGVVFIVFLILVVPLLGLLLLCRYEHGHRSEPRRSLAFPQHRLAAGRRNLAAAALPQRQAPLAQSHCAPAGVLSLKRCPPSPGGRAARRSGVTPPPSGLSGQYVTTASDSGVDRRRETLSSYHTG